MKDQTYTKKSLEKVLFRTRIKGLTSTQRSNLNSRLDKISKSITTEKFEFNNFNKVSAKNKWIWYNNSIEENLILKTLNSQLKTLLNVKQSNRNTIIKQLNTLLSAGNEFYIIKADISNFYESISWIDIINKLNSEHHVSIFVNHLLYKIFTITNSHTTGLPRGISLSSTLSEYCMKSFDEKIKKHKNIFFYKRFVDDIIILASDLNGLTQEAINNLLPYSLQTNSNKFEIHKVACRCKAHCECGNETCKCFDRCRCQKDENKSISLDYLGYNFKFSDIPEKKRKEKEIQISLSKTKVNKIKTRIIHSLISFHKNENKYLLDERLAFLTSNFYVYSNIVNSNLKAGIFYSYPELTNLSQLKELDIFLRKAICSKSGSFGAKMLSSFSPKFKKSMCKYSFYSGFTERRFKDFSSEDIALIKKCFRNG